MNQFIHFNGNLIPAEEPIVPAGNRGLRYGDGLFETMRVVKGRIVLADLHFERLFQGLALLQFQCPPDCTAATLMAAILALCRKMDLDQAARVRLNIVRGNGGLYDLDNNQPNVIIEAWPLAIPQNIGEGLRVDIYTEARKPMDALANLKSNNYLPYVLAAIHARQHQLQDCLLLNSAGRICDATIANVFWTQNGQLFTPPLSEGGVAGVMRRFLLDNLSGEHTIREQPLTVDTLLQADEVFLTNAIQGIKWIKQYREKQYGNRLATMLFNDLLKNLWQ